MREIPTTSDFCLGCPFVLAQFKQPILCKDKGADGETTQYWHWPPIDEWFCTLFEEITLLGGGAKHAMRLPQCKELSPKIVLTGVREDRR